MREPSRIAVIGLGYVGLPLAIALARPDDVVGFDVRCRRVAALRDGTLVRLRIMDEGDGIPPEDLERVFDKFYRVQAADRKRAGTGLGLAICRGFVEAMGGSIIASSRGDRRGAVFTITLPALAAVQAL